MTQFDQDLDGTLEVIRRLLEEPEPDQSPAGRIDDLYLVLWLVESLLAVGDDELCARMHHCGAWARQDLFEITGDGKHRDYAIGHLQVVVATAPTVDAAVLLAIALRDRSSADGSLDDLALAERVVRDALTVDLPQEDAAVARAVLGLVLSDRFDRTEQEPDLTEAIHQLTEAEPLFSPADPDRLEVVLTLGHLHLRGYFASPTGPGPAPGADLDRGIALLKGVEWHHRNVALRLAGALYYRFLHNKSRADRDDAIALLELLCTDHDVDPDDLLDLGDLYLARLREDGAAETYDRAIDCLRRAWRGGAGKAAVLAAQLVGAFAAGWDVPTADLAWFRELCTELVDTPDPEQQDPMWPGLLGLATAEEATRTNDPDVCREAIGWLTTAVRTDTTIEGNVPVYAVLAVMLVHEHTGRWPWQGWRPLRMPISDDDEDHRVLRWLEEHWAAVPATAPERPLFGTVAALFGVTTDTWADETAIARLRQALDLAPSIAELEPQLRFALGRVHAIAARRYERRADFETAFEMLTTALPRLSATFDRAVCGGMLGILTGTAYNAGLGTLLPMAEADDILSTALRDTELAAESRAFLLVAVGQIRTFRWLVDQRDGDPHQGVALHEQALRILPADSEFRADVRFGLAVMLNGRFAMTRRLDDLAMAEEHLTAVLPLAAERGDDDWVSESNVREVLEMITLSRAGESERLTATMADGLDASIARLSAKEDRSTLETRGLVFTKVIRALRQDDLEAMRSVMGEMADLPAAVAGSPLQKTIDSLRDMSRAGQHLVNENIQAFHDELANITARIREPDTVPEERSRLLFMVGATLLVAHNQTGDTAALDTAIDQLSQVYAEAAGGVEPFAMYAAENLSDLYWKKGDADRSIEGGFDALYQHGRQVLLHADIEHGITKAGAIADRAHVLAHRCVAAGRLEQAVAAVEGGRGLTMHAALSGPDIAAILRELGHETAAADGERADQRARVLGLLVGTPAERRILAPPALDEIAGALRVTGADALVYLVPGNKDHPGRAVVVRADARVTAIPLPMLDTADGGAVARYLEADSTPLDELVGWAWEAMAAPVLDELASWRLPATPHVVLVPCGSLGVVPWHAARDGGTGRYALERAVFSYAASARQLCDVARRPVRAFAEDPVVVADPTGPLAGAWVEARYLYEHRYPDGLYFGVLPPEVPADGIGTPDEVLDQLPGPRSAGASMLHLACHAAGGVTPAESYVKLFDSKRLSVKQLLEQAGARPRETPGGLVVLAACRSDLTDRDHDEVLTLATAFLSSGAASVVGTRWEVDDATSAVLMCLFHRYLAADRMTPAHALRAAQLWAIDPSRALPADIAAVTGTDKRPEIPLTTWAAFTHQGR